MVREIEKNNFLEIVEYRANPPISETQVKEVEEALKVPLTDPIKKFYREADGLYLRWRIDPFLDAEKTKRLQKMSNDYEISIAESENQAFARINLVSLYESVKKCNWVGVEPTFEDQPPTVMFNNHTLKRKEFIDLLRPLDLFSLDSYMAFVFQPGQNEPKVILLSEANSIWDQSRVSNFETYLEFLLATRGVVEAREKHFLSTDIKFKNTLIKGTDYWKKRTPKMFR
ncbi:hypothetical protein SAMN06269250_4205 [Spirosoma fluviale]|uniref:SMI1 / KNR4 family (SUKH-1) n=2 Tax=Spirosoma fluviale TaxID=1597977 RepID=A0A286GBD3_9BACT|nr:hypothetical protein SAMN06269250_4205 [Spirosoma fluviale]